MSYNGSGTFTGSVLTQFNALVAGASNAIVSVAPSATSGVPMISQGSSSNPAFGTAVVAGGGTGATSLTGVLTGNGTSAVTANAVTQHGILLGGASNAVSSLGVATNGQIAIGSTGADPVLATLTQGAGISITNGAGSITIAASGAGFTWATVTSATQAISVENGYVANRGAGVAFTLPASASVGDQFRIMGLAAGGGWSIAQNSGQTIQLGNTSTTTGTGGSLASTNAGDSVLVTCIVTNTNWSVADVIGNLTVV